MYFSIFTRLGLVSFFILLVSACGGSDSDKHTVSVITSSGGVATPISQSVNSGQTALVNLTANTGYVLNSVSGCDGNLNGMNYTTGAITSNCTVHAEFKINIYTLSTVATEGGSISPLSLNVEHGSVAELTVIADDGYSLQSISGCSGTLNGELYTTAAVLENCEVSASFQPLSVLQVERFGAGVLSDNIGALNCNASFCEQNYPRDTTVEVSAEPDNGWVLSHWNGCDSFVGNHCVVSLDQNKVIYPTFMRSSEPSLKTNVIILSQSFLSQIDSILDEAIIMRSGANLNSIAIGSVIVSQSGAGFARVITDIVTLRGASTILQTRNASLEEIIAEGTLVLNKTFTANDVVSLTKVDGIELVESKENNGSLNFSIKREINADVAIEGNVELKFSSDFAIDFGWKGINELRVAYQSNIKPEFSLTVNKSIPKVERTFTLPAVRFAPILVGPVVLTPMLAPTVTIKADATAEVVLSGYVAFNSLQGVQYHRNEGWKPLKTTNNTAQMSVEGAAKFSAEVFPSEEFALLIYGYIGPVVKIGPYSSAVASFDPVEQCGTWNTYYGLRSEAKVQGRILGWSLGELKLTLFNFKQPISNGVFINSCSDPDSSKPSQPGMPIAKSVYSRGLIVGWQASVDSNEQFVQRYMVYRDGKRLADVYDAEFQDAGLKPDTTYCYKTIGIDANNNQSDLSDLGCITTHPAEDDIPPTVPTNVSAEAFSSSSIALSWEAATDNVSAVSYLILENGEVINGTTDTSISILRLKPDTEYCYTIQALDAAGNASAQSIEACTTTNLSAAYRVRIKCEGNSSYVVDTRLDLDTELSNNVSVVGNATDYNGTPMTYALTGLYNNESNNLNGRIDWSFQNSSSTRIDEFTANLSNEDSGDVIMNQVKVTGCTAQIRFTKGLEVESQSFDKPVELSTGNISTLH